MKSLRQRSEPGPGRVFPRAKRAQLQNNSMVPPSLATTGTLVGTGHAIKPPLQRPHRLCPLAANGCQARVVYKQSGHTKGIVVNPVSQISLSRLLYIVTMQKDMPISKPECA